MWFFLLAVMAIYGSMNAYAFWKVCAAFPKLGYFRILLGAFLGVMVAAPVLARFLRVWGYTWQAGALGLVGHCWMAALFWFFVLRITADVWNLAVRAVALVAPRARAALLPARPTLTAIGGIVVLALVWGAIEARSIRIHNITVELDGLPPGSRPLRLAQISDLHLGSHASDLRLARVVRLIRQADPDILVSTGDLVDSSLRNADSLARLLREIDPPLGKFAVLGNHEFYAGLGASLAFHEACGFRVLRGESVAVGPALRIAGVDDPAGRRMGNACFTDEDAALPDGEEGAATILLKHQPRVAGASPPGFDLQLSGHAHGGQIFPWHVISALQYRFYRGLHALPGGSSIYVSPGAGTWGPPLRLFSRPEVTVISLHPPRRRRDPRSSGRQAPSASSDSAAGSGTGPGGEPSL